jgi:hypothetical protein
MMLKRIKDMIKNLIIIALLTFPCGKVLAQESRALIVREIVEVQGIRKMFEEQYAQQRSAIAAQGKQLYTQIVAGDDAKESKKSKEILMRFLTNTSDMISVDEMTNRWMSYYGTQLSEKELKDILAYYKTEIGKKDVAATQAAMTPFTAWFLQESQQRGEKLMAEFIREMENLP